MMTSEFSHREKGYLKTAQKSIIPYFYAAYTARESSESPHMAAIG